MKVFHLTNKTSKQCLFFILGFSHREGLHQIILGLNLSARQQIKPVFMVLTSKLGAGLCSDCSTSNPLPGDVFGKSRGWSMCFGFLIYMKESDGVPGHSLGNQPVDKSLLPLSLTPSFSVTLIS